MDTIFMETANGKTITLTHEISSDGYGNEFQDFRAYVAGKFFDNATTYDLRQGFIPSKAHDVFREAKASAWNR